MKKNIYVSAIVFILFGSMHAMEYTDTASGKDKDLGPVTIQENDDTKKVISLIQAFQFGKFKISEDTHKGASIEVPSHFNADQQYEYSLKEFNNALEVEYQNIISRYLAWALFFDNDEETVCCRNFYLFMDNQDLYDDHDAFEQLREGFEWAKKRKKWSESEIKQDNEKITAIEDKYKEYAKRKNSTLKVVVPQIKKHLSANRKELKQAIMAEDKNRIQFALTLPLHPEQIFSAK